MKITDLFHYPIKSMSGNRLSKAQLVESGFEFDRYYMLVNQGNRGVTQREEPRLALIDVSVEAESLTVSYKNERFTFSNQFHSKESISALLFEHTIESCEVSTEASQWFSQVLQKEVRLVEQNSLTGRRVNKHKDSKVEFHDGHQVLLIGSASMDLLNSKLEKKININRFRPNIVVETSEPHIEDNWKIIEINGIKFEVTKQCGRCIIPNVDQSTAMKGKEPTATLAGYRLQDKSIKFGIYLKQVAPSPAAIHVGDEIVVS